MGIFNIFKKKIKDKKEEHNMSTLDEVRKAYEDLSDDDKKKFALSLSEDAPEKGAEQEKDGGTEESQSAEDRDPPVPAEEHAEESGDGADGDEETAESEPAAETTDDDAKWRKEVDARFARIEETLGQIMQQGKRTPAPADNATAERLKRAESIFS